MSASLVGSEMCIRDRPWPAHHGSARLAFAADCDMHHRQQPQRCYAGGHQDATRQRQAARNKMGAP
eukprot:3295889-Alexandrium_andersonii.AAC.1